MPNHKHTFFLYLDNKVDARTTGILNCIEKYLLSLLIDLVINY